MSDDLTATDGISNFFITFDGFRKMGDGGDAVVDFAIREVEPSGHNRLIAHMPIEVAAGADGLNGLIVRAHDKLVSALRQMLYVANMQRRQYREVASEWVRRSPSTRIEGNGGTCDPASSG